MTSFADLTLPTELMNFLEQHRDSAYAVLFLGAFFETLIPFSLAILGEIFFLAGAILAGLGTLDLWAVTTALYLGGILGDNTSYWIGRRYGQGLFERLSRLPLAGRLLHAENYQKGIELFRRRGAFAVLAARFSGPLSWVTPALAGVFRLDYPLFLRFNTLGVVLGIGQFILLGYFFGSNLESLLAWLDRFGLLILVMIIGLSFVGWRFFRTSKQTN
jgi:membrane-associated protein